jgi:hypothetical protein
LPNFLGIVSAVTQILVKLSMKSPNQAENVKQSNDTYVEMKEGVDFIAPKSSSAVELSDTEVFKRNFLD